ncbi:MAG: 2OG-Fe(II) oxygenase [Chromatiales bacterium]
MKAETAAVLSRIAMALPARSTQPPEGPDRYEAIALAVGDRGWCVSADFVPPLVASELAVELRRAWRRGALRHAGVGRGADLEVKPEVRSDRVLWIDPQTACGAVRHYLAAIEALRQAMNRLMYMGLVEIEGHFAVYPPGARYRRHLDQFRGIGTRTLTCILYLNPSWTAGDGGELRLYTDGDREDVYVDLPPRAGRMVTFLSARFFHEVLPARRERLSITSWLKRRDGRSD